TRLHRERADAEARRVATHAHARGNRDGAALGREPDTPTEEEEEVLVRRRRRAHAIVPRRVADVEHAGILEEELALLRKELAELREIDLLLVRLDLREVGVDGNVER